MLHILLLALLFLLIILSLLFYVRLCYFCWYFYVFNWFWLSHHVYVIFTVSDASVFDIFYLCCLCVDDISLWFDTWTVLVAFTDIYIYIHIYIYLLGLSLIVRFYFLFVNAKKLMNCYNCCCFGWFCKFLPLLLLISLFLLLNLILLFSWIIYVVFW